MFVQTEDESAESRIKVLDFGIAKLSDGASEQLRLQTRPGQILGTPTYMAPEQAGGPGPVGAHTDVYALGVMFFEMLSGQPPFTGEDSLQLIGQHMFLAPPRLGAVLPNADLEVDELINRMLSKTSEMRPSMREIKLQLGKISRRTQVAGTKSATRNDDSDISQADTVIYRTSEHAVESRAIPSGHALRSAWRLKPVLLVAAIFICGVVALGSWLVLRNWQSNLKSVAAIAAGFK